MRAGSAVLDPIQGRIDPRVRFREEYARFEELATRFQAQFHRIGSAEVPEFTLPHWKATGAELTRALLPRPRFSFLRERRIVDTMFVGAGGAWLEHQLSYLERWLPPPELAPILRENYVGRPRLHSRRYRTSHNSVHHLYHVARFTDAIGGRRRFTSVIEWGGGYGNLAKLVWRLHRPKPLTYVIIDLPLFSCLQWLYLSTAMGPDNVNLVASPDAEIVRGSINLLPVGVARTAALRADVFVSTWALSESSAAAQDHVRERSWLGARHLLLAYQEASAEFPAADRLGALAVEDGATRYAIPFLSGNYYAFR